jgi:hypothetical protein
MGPAALQYLQTTTTTCAVWAGSCHLCDVVVAPQPSAVDIVDDVNSAVPVVDDVHITMMLLLFLTTAQHGTDRRHSSPQYLPTNVYFKLFLL